MSWLIYIWMSMIGFLKKKCGLFYVLPTQNIRYVKYKARDPSISIPKQKKFAASSSSSVIWSLWAWKPDNATRWKVSHQVGISFTEPIRSLNARWSAIVVHNSCFYKTSVQSVSLIDIYRKWASLAKTSRSPKTQSLYFYRWKFSKSRIAIIQSRLSEMAGE